MILSRLPGLARYVLNGVPDAGCSAATRPSAPARISRNSCRGTAGSSGVSADICSPTMPTRKTPSRRRSSCWPGPSNKSLFTRRLPLGPWLHGTAYRVCMKARRAQARRARGERAAAAVRKDRSQPVADSTWESAFAALCEEVHNLPESQRAAFVLCGLEGRTQVGAAAALGQRSGRSRRD